MSEAEENARAATSSGIVEPDERLYHQLIRSLRDYAIFMLDPSGHVISWNAGAENIKGYRAPDILGSHFSRFFSAEQRAAGLPAKALQVAAQEGRFEDEGWRERKDGARYWANVIIIPLRDDAGTLIGFANVTRDLTERRRQEDTLRQSEERYRALIAGVKDYAIFVLDPKGFVLTWNAGAEYIKGYQAHEILGSHFSRFYPPESIKSGLPERELRGATMEGRFEDEGWRIRKDGSRFWANVIITAMRDASGNLIGFSKITRNLTERRKQQEDLRLSEERFRLLVEGVTEYAIIMLDRDGFVSSWNGGAERINGYLAQEVLGRHVSHFYAAEDIAANKPWRHLALARDKGRSTDEGWRVRKDGTLFWASNVITALHDREGKPYGFANVTQDLTQRRHAEALADTTQRMHEFIAMLAHELRNPLAPITNAVALMARKGLDDPALEAMRQTIERQSAHLTRLLDELLDVNRIARGKFAVEKESIELQEVLDRAVETSRPLIDAQAHRLRLTIPDAPIPVLGDRMRLTQAFVNLLNNAAKYTPTGGDIWLSAVARSTDVEVRVRDSGKGIDHSMLEKVFDLFVQVDPNNGGMMGGLGVGLALVRRVVELHGGSVQARSEGAGKGSEFVVRLPLSIQTLRVVAPARASKPRVAAARRVLVVDDNRDAADSLAMLLEAMGHDVTAVYDAAAALAAANSIQPDIVMLDIGMPHTNGYEVARRIRGNAARNPPFLVAITGWGQESDKQRARDAGFDRHFVKPVSEEALRDVLAEASRERRR
jgi:PAS domain S-box-containing protein